MPMESITREWVCGRLPKSHKNDHKGTRGTLNLVAGSARYRGAALLAAEAALRAGAGLTRLVGTEAVCSAAAARLPCLILEPVKTGVAGGIGVEGASAALTGRPTAILAGCGMGSTAETALLTGKLLSTAPCPLVLDADGLNTLAGHTSQGYNETQRLRLLTLLGQRTQPTVITPHIGEMARLAGLSIADASGGQAEVAASFAKTYGCVVVAKSHVTVIAGPEGEVYANDSAGNPGLATGGSGDVLAGITGSLLAQGMKPIEAAACAVWLHATAADLVAGQKGYAALSPADLPGALATTLHSINR